MLTEQQYYDLLVESAQNGTFPSVNADRTFCMYRGEGGSKCAVGIIIPDNEYTKSIEHGSIDALTRIHHLLPKWTLEIDAYNNCCYIRTIQKVHDVNALSEEGWDATEFIKNINNLKCFSGVVKCTI